MARASNGKTYGPLKIVSRSLDKTGPDRQGYYSFDIVEANFLLGESETKAWVAMEWIGPPGKCKEKSTGLIALKPKCPESN